MERLSCQQRDHSRRGFTLLETTISLMILGFGLLSVAAMQLQALDYARRGRHQTQAAVFAQSRMEILQRQPWATIAPTDWTAPVTVSHIVTSSTSHVEQRYDVSWRISNLVLGQTRAIDVRVVWDERERPGRVYAISSARFKRD